MTFFLTVSLFVMSLSVFAHGENKAGPHGGHIRMPGAFHTELVLESQVVRVYLLDMSFKNSTTENSKISLSALSKAGSIPAHCSEKKTFYECRFPEKISTYSKIKLTAQRKGLKGKEVHYPLPLKFKDASMDIDHSQHN